MVIKVPPSSVVRTESIDTRKETQNTHNDRIHGVEESAHKMPKRSLHDSLNRVNSILSKSSRLPKLVVEPVNVLHNNREVQSDVRDIEPKIKDKKVHNDIENNFLEPEFVSRVIPVVRRERVDFPHPESREHDEPEQRHHAQVYLFLHILHALRSFWDWVRVLEDSADDEEDKEVEERNVERCPAVVGEVFDF